MTSFSFLSQAWLHFCNVYNLILVVLWFTVEMECEIFSRFYILGLFLNTIALFNYVWTETEIQAYFEFLVFLVLAMDVLALLLWLMDALPEIEICPTQLNTLRSVLDLDATVCVLLIAHSL